LRHSVVVVVVTVAVTVKYYQKDWLLTALWLHHARSANHQCTFVPKTKHPFTQTLTSGTDETSHKIESG